ncbi:hypothetical protein HPB49_003713 [Dermacentor silvarum]|uniref:Uncharacterized protein n=1 Tax=Dermacentor silvarum TaxID=543639 RepID=A0ACB8DU05_DERSI|nr:hypothetical protein HPB49_003713 [Dermacentor silvarum]
MCLPSRSTLKRYLASYRSTFGFNSKVLRQLKAKTVGIDPFRRHGGIIIDELKLSEHLSVKQNGVIEGFVDLGQFSTPAQRHTVSDHGMVVLFVPFVGKWSQIIGSFATSGNMKAEVLAKVITEATILAENSGLFVDFVTCDGASWNRKMWKIMGIGGGATYVNCNVQHRVDSSRSLFFLSDFPHLIKCLRNSLLKNGFDTPDGLVTVEHVKEAYKIDASSLTLKAMTGITQRHLAPNNFEKMRVTYAFQLFGKKVLQGLHLYKAELEKKYGSVTATQTFFKRIRTLIDGMTSRFPAEALRPSSQRLTALKDFLILDQAFCTDDIQRTRRSDVLPPAPGSVRGGHEHGGGGWNEPVLAAPTPSKNVSTLYGAASEEDIEAPYIAFASSATARLRFLGDIGGIKRPPPVSALPLF